MQLNNTYKDIWAISYPLMLFNLAQNIIGVTDMVFLGRVGETEQAACGLVGIYYMIFVMLGFGLSRGAQIMIARRLGEQKYALIGGIFDNLLIVMMVLATALFLNMQFLSPNMLWLFIKSPEVYAAGWDYLFYRSFGIFFSLFGFTLLALYSGIGQTKVISFITATILGVNIFLNYSLVFGYFGFPELGIAGAGIASSTAEGVATIVGLIFLLTDKKLKPYGLLKFKTFSWTLSRKLAGISTPLLLSFLFSFGGWFVFFTFIEKLGVRALAISSVVRWMYSFFSIPAWSIGATANSVISNLIGSDNQKEVPKAIFKISNLSFILTVVACVVILFIPELILSIFTNDVNVIQEAKPLMTVLIAILIVCSISSIIFNAVVGTGATFFSLVIQGLAVATYLSFAWIVINYFDATLWFAWGSEMLYWTLLMIPAVFFFYSDRWKHIKV